MRPSGRRLVGFGFGLCFGFGQNRSRSRRGGKVGISRSGRDFQGSVGAGGNLLLVFAGSHAPAFSTALFACRDDQPFSRAGNWWSRREFRAAGCCAGRVVPGFRRGAHHFSSGFTNSSAPFRGQPCVGQADYLRKVKVNVVDTCFHTSRHRNFAGVHTFEYTLWGDGYRAVLRHLGRRTARVLKPVVPCGQQ